VKSLRDLVLEKAGYATDSAYLGVPAPEGAGTVGHGAQEPPGTVPHVCRNVGVVAERWRLGQREVRKACWECGTDLGWRKARAGEQVAG
jgi:hypothetical protein